MTIRTEAFDASDHVSLDRGRHGSTEGVDLLRSRLELFAASFAVLSLTASVACPAAGVVFLGKTWAQQIAHPGNQMGLLAPVPLIAVWACCRFGRTSRPV